MTALCGGAASQAKAGVPQMVSDDATAIAAVLALLGFEVPALISVLISPAAQFIVSTF
jgi:hypothetical protein